MSIASFATASLEQAATGRHDVALALACSAVDGTAAKIPELCDLRNNERNKKFLDENLAAITAYGFPGIDASAIRIKCINVDGLRTDANGYVSISDIIYHAIRCSTVHECKIDQRIEFTDETYIGDFDTTFKLPRQLILGLLAAVIQAPINADEEFDANLAQRIDALANRRGVD